jgi:hypothetical protein
MLMPGSVGLLRPPLSRMPLARRGGSKIGLTRTASVETLCDNLVYAIGRAFRLNGHQVQVSK